MAIWPIRRYPGTSYTEINLDWIMRKLKQQIEGLVASVNGKTGNVILDASDVHALPDTYIPPAAPVDSVNGKTGTVVLDYTDVGALPDTYTPPAAPVQSVNTQTGDVVLPIPPSGGSMGQVLAKDTNADYDYSWQTVSGGGAVDSVNGQTGTVVLDANDVGALPDTYTAPVESVNGLTGTVTISAGTVGALGIQKAADATSVGTQYNLNGIGTYTEFMVIICCANGANHNTIYYVDAPNDKIRLLGNVASGITPSISSGYLTIVSTQTAHVFICPLPPV